MAFMLKIRWDIKKDKVADFKSNQQALCRVMLEHPGVKIGRASCRERV